VGIWVQNANAHNLFAELRDLEPSHDPYPGACKYAASAQQQGRRLMRIICYCEPAAFELFIPVPNERTLLSWKFDLDWPQTLM
jgi:hypothetical protein